MGMLYEYEGFENLFKSGEIVTIDAQYAGKVSNGHKVRVRWYPDAIDNDGQIKIVNSNDIFSEFVSASMGILHKGSKIKLRVEYVAYHREDYHIIQINSPESGRDDMLVHRSLFDIPKDIESNRSYLCEQAA